MKQWKSQASWKNPDWKYQDSASTNVAQTIARVKQEMEILNGWQKNPPIKGDNLEVQGRRQSQE